MATARRTGRRSSSQAGTGPPTPTPGRATRTTAWANRSGAWAGTPPSNGPAAGHALYTARTSPKEYWNRTAFVAEPTGHLVGTFVIEPNGADFKSRNSFNLLASMDEWTAPIMAEVGPDGNVWVIDWYAYIVQHNPTPVGYKTGAGGAYITPRRDQEHGRIYRITYSGGKESKKLDLSKASSAELAEALKNDNPFWRPHGQR